MSMDGWMRFLQDGSVTNKEGTQAVKTVLLVCGSYKNDFLAQIYTHFTKMGLWLSSPKEGIRTMSQDCTLHTVSTYTREATHAPMPRCSRRASFCCEDGKEEGCGSESVEACASEEPGVAVGWVMV
jgi:hypothetical protein